MYSDWAWLPPHLLQSIFEKAETQLDFLHMEIVCSLWHSAANDNIMQNIFRALPLPIPMLIIPSEENDSHNLYNVLSGSFLNSKIEVSFDKRFGGSYQGWLLVVEKDYSVTLYKAGGGQSSVDSIVRLPPLFSNYDPDDDDDVAQELVHYHVTKVIFTADPLTDSDRCTIVVLFTEIGEVAFIRPAKDSTWTRSGQMLINFDELLYFNNRFYGVNYNGKLRSFMITEQGIISDIKLVADVPSAAFVDCSVYLVESRGKIYQVVRYMKRRFLNDEDHTVSIEDNRTIHRETKKVEVYELDFGGAKWIEVKSIGDLAFFMGDNSSVSVSASRFSGCRPNSIYFTHGNDGFRSCKHVICDYGMYDLETGRMELHFGLDNATTAKISHRVPIWLYLTP